MIDVHPTKCQQSRPGAIAPSWIPTAQDIACAADARIQQLYSERSQVC